MVQPALETVSYAGDYPPNDDDSDEEMPPQGDDDGSDGNNSDTEAAGDVKDKYLAPYEIEARLRLLWSNHSDFLNYVWRRALAFSSQGENTWNVFFVRSILVPPSRFRPSSDMGDMQTEHPQNLHLSKILSLNESLLNLATQCASVESASHNVDVTALQKKPNADVSKLISTWIDLQNAVNCYLDSSKDTSRKAEDTFIGIRQILEKKEGLFRKHMMGKRVNFCCRSVISPDPFLGMNEIGIPVRFARELHYPTPVTSWNIKLLRQMVENGPEVYPGTRMSLPAGPHPPYTSLFDSYVSRRCQSN